MKMVELGKVIDINPRLPRGTDHNTEASFIAMADVGEDGSWSVSETKTVGELKKGYTYFAKNDVVFAKITPCFENGKAAYFSGLPTEIGFGSTEFHVLRPNKDVDGQYLYYTVWNPDFRAYGTWRMSGAVGQKRVTTDFLKKYEIPLPPLSEQKRIAAILDKADAIRRKRKAALDMADEFLRATFLDMFGDPVTNPKGWDVKPLGRLIKSNPKNGTITPAKEGGALQVVKVGQLGRYWIDQENCQEIDLSDKDRDRFSLEIGDILLARAIGSQSHLGKASIVSEDETNLVFDSHVMRVRFDHEQINPSYFWFWLKTNGGRTLFLKQSSQTAVQFNINGKQIAKLPVTTPPMREQEKFVGILNKVFERFNVGESGEEDDLFASLSQRAFRGEL
ncbi:MULTISPECIES: restriction endonuclease subunit S [unclassified Pseudodesulfovibrio]|uniref:restriction endonuclease subunit S n=1 Tax=unclassified Pseudodesulfovibrio TaxID=2661612 RepID=UPI000FEB6C37|nr:MULTISPECIES: restriction endonuclease subunit S [unclassified Pseudodesulfovibrio]MCJ2165236.1 restriction endonuclease subunit S [Pseudodesulfovibrio sp. S3-i]RWU03290.1 hypothetical protein DWB63_11855 [Pseudodesulfovibrio sp. S3]